MLDLSTCEMLLDDELLNMKRDYLISLGLINAYCL